MKKILQCLLYALSCAVHATPVVVFNATASPFTVGVVEKPDGCGPMRREPSKVQHTQAMASLALPGSATPQFLISGVDNSAQEGGVN